MSRTNHWIRICLFGTLFTLVATGCPRAPVSPDSGDDCLGDTCRADTGRAGADADADAARIDAVTDTGNALDVVRFDTSADVIGLDISVDVTRVDGAVADVAHGDGVADVSIDTGNALDVPVDAQPDVRPDTRPDVAVDVRSTDVSTVDVTTPPDVITVTDAGPAAGFDGPTSAHIRDIVARGRALGNRADVFSKLGDSITESASFLGDFGFGWYDLGTHTALMPTLTLFSARLFPDGRNSFNRQSLCATAGWTVPDAITGGAASPLARELDAIQPLFAIVMYGTNDLDHDTDVVFAANMRTLIDRVEAHGTLPILSTIPNRHDRPASTALVPSFNAAIRSVASERHLPLIEFNAALAPLPVEGLNPDGIHPNSYFAAGFIRNCDLTPAGLQFGYVERNLTAVEMLDRLRAF